MELWQHFVEQHLTNFRKQILQYCAVKFPFHAALFAFVMDLSSDLNQIMQIALRLK